MATDIDIEGPVSPSGRSRKQRGGWQWRTKRADFLATPYFDIICQSVLLLWFCTVFLLTMNIKLTT